MKKLRTLAFLSLIFAAKLTAQNADSTNLFMVKDSIIHYFNKLEFSKIYAMTDVNFHKQLTENQLVSVLENNIYKSCGKITAHDFLEKKNGTYHFKLTHEKAELLMILGIDTDKKISTLFFKPYVSVTKREKKSASDNPLKTDLDKTVDSLARTYIDLANTAGLSIGVIENGQILTYHYGETDKKSMKLPTNNTLYEIGSITKTFTGLLLAQAVFEKKIDLMADIRQYLPEKYPNLTFENQPILIQHLANHTAGLVSFPSEDIAAKPNFDARNPYKHYTSDHVLAYLHTVKLERKPGEKAEYSNFATGLMGIILEKVYGMSYEALLKKYITDPLSTPSIKITLSDADKANFATAHDENGNTTSHWDITGLGAAGAIRANLTDMLRYAQLNRDAETEAIRLAQTPTFRQNKSTQTGLYWQLQTNSKGQLIVWHNGGTGGFSTFCGFLKEKKLAIVVMANSSVSTTQLAFDLLKALNR